MRPLVLLPSLLLVRPLPVLSLVLVRPWCSLPSRCGPCARCHLWPWCRLWACYLLCSWCGPSARYRFSSWYATLRLANGTQNTHTPFCTITTEANSFSKSENATNFAGFEGFLSNYEHEQKHSQYRTTVPIWSSASARRPSNTLVKPRTLRHASWVLRGCFEI